MISCVLDASVILAIVLGEDSDYANTILAEYLEKEALIFVPSLWYLELYNVLNVKERSGKISRDYVDSVLDSLGKYTLSVDHDIGSKVTLGAIHRLARHYWLTVYDATYIELALRLRIPLASLDLKMQEVARDLSLFLEA